MSSNTICISIVYIYSCSRSISSIIKSYFSGEIRFNNGTYASATAIYIDDADANGVTTQTDTITWDDSTSTIKGYLHIVDTDDPTTYARFSITGSSTDASGYNKLAVTHLLSLIHI